MKMEKSKALAPIELNRSYDASIEEVWKAVATSEGLAGWFMPNDFQPVEGSRFDLNSGQFGMSPCIVKALNPPKHLSFSWGKDWVLSFDLRGLNGKTELALTHSGWDSNKLTEFNAPHPAVRENMARGWANLLEKLRDYVEG
ncbi:SRPBCC family protein [Mesobacillus foraminis]|uniref:SRPBCC family protein n=1 Tax=Mesobacillus foraminis TaxID=279826 RepID=UPI00399F13BF